MRQGRLFGKRQAPIRGKVYKCPEGPHRPPHDHCKRQRSFAATPGCSPIYGVGADWSHLRFITPTCVILSPPSLSQISQIRRNQKGGPPLYNVTKVNSKIRSIHQICVLTCQPLDYLSCHYLCALLVIIPLFSVIISSLALPLTTDRPCPFFRSEARPKRLF